MSMSRSDSGAAVSRSRSVVALACLLLLPGCADAQQTGAAPPTADAAVDWLNTTYSVTCDGIVPDGFPATVVDGSARVPADGSRPPYYDHYDVRVTATASGDVDGDGAPDSAVVLDCSPQPSNGIVQEVQVLSSTGRLLGTLPSPRTMPENVQLPPVYDRAGLSVQDGEVVAAMTAYGPEDFHASGPSVPLTVRWRFDGQGFVRVSS
ncbi:hypothetical protein [Modestobacter altitudinis]|uniref:hypothetical protein n=1 Tax=Modestobacter altitudinis TaxID=2213158 RepID=UPI00110D0201|nr:hypothetical protein [Modestobacter altitudinis]